MKSTIRDAVLSSPPPEEHLLLPKENNGLESWLCCVSSEIRENRPVCRVQVGGKGDSERQYHWVFWDKALLASSLACLIF